MNLAASTRPRPAPLGALARPRLTPLAPLGRLTPRAPLARLTLLTLLALLTLLTLLPTAAQAQSTAGVTVTPTTLEIAENAAATYTVTLDAQPTDDVTVTPASAAAGNATVNPPALTFTTTSWDTPQTVTVTGAPDDALTGDRTAKVHHAVAGGGYDGVTATDVTVTITNVDVATVTLDTDPATAGAQSNPPTVADADDAATPADETRATWTVVLDKRPTGNVTVTPASATPANATVSPPALTFTTMSWATPRTVTLTGVPDDTIGDDRTTMITHTVAGGGYDAVTIPDMTVTVTNTDVAGVTIDTDPATTGVQSDPPAVGDADDLLTPADETRATWTVVLDKRPTATVTVTPASDAPTNAAVSPPALTFTTTSWNTPQTVTVTGVADDALAGDRIATITHTAAGGGYGAVTTPEMTVTVTDTDRPLVVIPFPQAFIDENAGQSRPTTWTWRVALGVRPTGDVTVSLTPDDATARHAGAVQVSHAALTFTTSNWATSQTVTVNSVDDDVVGSRQVSFLHTARGGGYTGAQGARAFFTVTVSDTGPGADTGGVTVSETALTVAEADDGATPADERTATYTIVLDKEPTDSVSVDVDVGVDAGLTASETLLAGPASLTFRPQSWATPQTVTVTGVSDEALGDRTATLSHTIDQGAGFYDVSVADVTVTVANDDTPGLAVGATSLTVREGRTVNWLVRLNKRPSADRVSVGASLRGVPEAYGKPAVVVSHDVALGEVLHFTPQNWNTYQTMSLITRDDDLLGEYTIEVVHHASGGAFEGLAEPSLPVTVTNHDDVAGATLDTDPATAGAQSGALTVAEAGAGNAALYTVVLDRGPAAQVTVTPLARGADGTGSSEAVGVSGALTFTGGAAGNWSTPQTVTVTGRSDDVLGDRTATIAHTFAGGGYDALVVSPVTVTVTDDDAPGLTVTTSSPTPTVSEAGGATTWTVVLDNRPTGAVTVTPASSDPSAATVSPPSLTFTTTSWDTPQTVTVTGVGDDALAGDRTAMVAHTAAGGGYDGVAAPEVTVTVANADVAAVTVDTDPAVAGVQGDPPAVGDADDLLTPADETRATWTVVLDARPTDTVTVTPASDAPGNATVGPPALTFTTTSWSTPQTVTVTGVGDDALGDDRAATITHTVAGGGYGAVTIPDMTVTVTDTDRPVLVLPFREASIKENGSAAETSWTWRVALGVRPTGDVTVSVAPDATYPHAGAVRVSPPALTFTTGNWDTSQTVTVNAVADEVVGSRQATVLHTAAGGGYDGAQAYFNVTVSDTGEDADTGGVTVSETALTVAEADGGATPADERIATYTIVLDARPTNIVSIDVDVGVDAGLTASEILRVGPASLTFRPQSWATPQTVTVTGVDDETLGDRTATLSHTIDRGARFYDVPVAGVTVTVTDDDVAGLEIDATTPAVREGRTVDWRVRLSARPAAARVSVGASLRGVPEAYGKPAAVVSHDLALGEVLHFTPQNWNTYQTMSLIARDDDLLGDYTVEVAHRASGGAFEGLTGPSLRLTVTNHDDVAGATVDTDPATPGVQSGALAVAETGAGDTALYTVVLDRGPTAQVTVTPHARGADGTGSTDAVRVSGALTFTGGAAGNWATPRTVTVTGVPDDGPGDRTATVAHTFAGGGYDALVVSPVTVTVTHVAPAGATLSATALRVAEAGGTARYTVVLDDRPTGEVTVTPVSWDPEAVTVSGALTFTTGDWETPRTVTVTGVADTSPGDRTVAIAHTFAGGGYDAVAARLLVTAVDDDAGALVLATTPTVAEAGGTATWTVLLGSRPRRRSPSPPPTGTRCAR